VDDALSTNVPGIFSCGNVLHVHDLADSVTLEAYRAGAGAARFVKGAGVPYGATQIIKGAGVPYGADGMSCVNSGRGVRYVTPAFLRRGAAEYELLFRSDGVYKDAEICVYADGALLLSKKKRIVTPGEMERLVIKDADCKTVSVEIRERARP
jgi:sarcosine oxidase subunit alpha